MKSMFDAQLDSECDPSLQKFREARDVAAALKIELLNFSANNPDSIIFAFEGKDDKVIYSHWIRQFSVFLSYEPFPCQNKYRTLKLKESLERDLNELGRNVYFFVDRDFDDLAGTSNSANLFMTDRYSVENYLVSTHVLDQILKNEFHCHGKPVCRQNVIDLFCKQYSLFLEQTKELNFRIFLAKKLKIQRTKRISSKINSIAMIELAIVKSSEILISEVVPLEREPTQVEIDKYRPEFDKLASADRYRGKFCFGFFKRWIELLAYDRNSNDSILFPDLEREHLKAPTNINLDSFASKALPPSGLNTFLQLIFSPSHVSAS